MKLWGNFVRESSMELLNMVRLVRIMLSVPANTSWIERGFSMLEMICSKRRNKLGVNNIAALFLTKVLGIPAKSVQEYEDEISLLAAGKDALKKNLFFVWVEVERVIIVTYDKLLTQMISDRLWLISTSIIVLDFDFSRLMDFHVRKWLSYEYLHFLGLIFLLIIW